MSHQGKNRRGGWPAFTALRAVGLTPGITLWVVSATGLAQVVPSDPPPGAAPLAPIAPVVAPGPAAPGSAVVAPGTTAPGVVVMAPDAVPALGSVGVPILPPDVQVVRFQGPPGMFVEVLAPSPIPVPIGDGQGIATVGLSRGVGYRLRITNIPERPGAELFPVIEVVGHLHRPEGIDPAKYPIRVIFTSDDIDPVLDLGRLVTKVIYLEDPDEAMPFRMTKDQIPVVTLNPTEPPLRVASALGRPMAIVRIGGRRPTIEEVNEGATGDMGMDWAAGLSPTRCPFLNHDGTPCAMPCGPVHVTPPAKPTLPRDEYLCDGGDRGVPVTVGPDGRLGGIEPRDAIVRFNIGVGSVVKPIVLPTNVVCVYAPRFAEVRVSTGTNQAVDVQSLKTDKALEAPSRTSSLAGSKRLVQNQAAELARHRSRASGLKAPLHASEESNKAGPSGYENSTQVHANFQKQGPELARLRQKPSLAKERVRLNAIKMMEKPVITGIEEGAGEMVKVWGPHSMTGLETPPNRPGLAVIKRVSAGEAEPGDTLTFVILYRNMGNSPISHVAIVDSLIPRLEYVKGTSRGPEGTAFSTAENRVGATELRWELPEALKPGVSGHVSFQAIVR